MNEDYLKHCSEGAACRNPVSAPTTLSATDSASQKTGVCSFCRKLKKFRQPTSTDELVAAAEPRRAQPKQTDTTLSQFLQDITLDLDDSPQKGAPPEAGPVKIENGSVPSSKMPNIDSELKVAKTKTATKKQATNKKTATKKKRKSSKKKSFISQEDRASQVTAATPEERSSALPKKQALSIEKTESQEPRQEVKSAGIKKKDHRQLGPKKTSNVNRTSVKIQVAVSKALVIIRGFETEKQSLKEVLLHRPTDKGLVKALGFLLKLVFLEVAVICIASLVLPLIWVKPSSTQKGAFKVSQEVRRFLGAELRIFIPVAIVATIFSVALSDSFSNLSTSLSLAIFAVGLSGGWLVLRAAFFVKDYAVSRKKNSGD